MSKILLTIILLSVSCTSLAQATTTTDKPTNTNNEPAKNSDKPATDSNQLTDLEYYLPKAEINKLNASTSVLKLEYNSAIHKGCAILIPDWSLTPTTPKQINKLRTRLTKIGFTTLALIPPAIEFTTKTSQTDGKPEANDYQTKLLAQLQQIEQTAATIPGFKLLLVQGINSSFISEFIATDKLTAFDAIVLLNAYYPQLKTNQELAISLAKLTIPVLDIEILPSNQWQTDILQLRAETMHKQIKLDYRQQQLTLDHNQQQLFKSIYGWLTALGWY